MNIRRLILLLPMLLLCGMGMAQKGNDVLYLHDGSVIRGTIIEYIAGDHIRIRTEEGKVFEFPAAQIKKTSLDGKVEAVLKKHGFVNNTNLGLLIGQTSGRMDANISFQTLNGWIWNYRWQTSVGVGLELFDSQGMMPVFGEGRYHILPGEVSPYVALQGGYLVPINQDQYYYDWWGSGRTYKGGPMAGVEVGLRNMIKNHFGFTVSMGYRFQVLTSEYSGYFFNGSDYVTAPVTERTYMNRLALRVGILFN